MLTPAQKQHYRTILGELQRRHDELTKHIAALDDDISHSLDSEAKLVFRERRDPQAAERDQVAEKMAQLERLLEMPGELDPDSLTGPERFRSFAKQARPRVINKRQVIPDLRHPFFDRKQEIDALKMLLFDPTARLIAICGREGFGKTTLLAQLLSEVERAELTVANQSALQVVGIAYFHPEKTPLTLKRLYSDFGALLGEPYSSDLDVVRQSEGTLKDQIYALRGQLIRACGDDECILVVLDGFEHVMDDDGKIREAHSDFGTWLEVCLEPQIPVRFIITSRRSWHAPGGIFLSVEEQSLNEGLPEEDALALLHSLVSKKGSQIADDAEVLVKAAHLTEGIPMALVRIAGVWQHLTPSDLQRLHDDATLVETGIAKVLADYAYDLLLPDEKEVMEVLATYRLPVVTPAIAYLLKDRPNIVGTLGALERKYFAFFDAEHKNWSIRRSDRHAVLLSLRLRPDDLTSLHHEAARYYETQELEKNRLEAVYHYQQAGDYERAAHLATADVWKLITQGQAGELRQLLDQFTAERLSTLLWIQVQIGLGDACRFLSEIKSSSHSYQTALAVLEAHDRTSQTPLLIARACLGLGELTRQESVSTAREWLQKGIDVLDGAEEPALMAELLIKLGAVKADQGDYEASIESTANGLVLLPDGPNPLRVRGLINLGGSYFLGRNDAEQGLSATQQAVEMSENLRDLFLQMKALNNLALFYDISGRWADALTTYEAALAIVRQLGNPPGEVQEIEGQTRVSPSEAVQLANNISILYMNTGQFDQAAEHLHNAEDIARKGGRHLDRAFVLAGRADLEERLEDWRAAAFTLDEAEKLARSIGAIELLPELHYLQSNAYRGLGQIQAARESAERALELAEDPINDGKAQRALAQALLGEGQIEPASAAFEESLRLLADQDPYETARTQTAYGQALLAQGDSAYGHDLLNQAQDQFRSLGALHDLEIVDRLLNAG